MKILAIDTATNTAAAAVMEDEMLLGESILNHKKTHSQQIMPMIDRLLEQLELDITDIDLFAVSVGPGSFTGLRIGVAAMKGLAHGTNKPMIGVNTLEAMAYNLPYCEHMIVPLLDARQNRVYTASYLWSDAGLEEVTPPEACTIEECVGNCADFMETIFVGDGMFAHKDYIKDKLDSMAIFATGNASLPKASAVAAAAYQKWKNGEVSDYHSVNPFYIKKCQAEQEYDEKMAKKSMERNETE